MAADTPWLVSGLVLMEPIVRGRREEAWPKARLMDGRSLIDLTRVRRNHWPSREEAARFFSNNKNYRDWHPEVLEAFLSHGLAEAVEGGTGEEGAGQGGLRPRGLQLACPPWLEADFYELEPGEMLFQWAERCQCPVVLIMGADSEVVHPGGHGRPHQSLRGGDSFHTAGGPHLPHATSPGNGAGAGHDPYNAARRDERQRRQKISRSRI